MLHLKLSKQLSEFKLDIDVRSDTGVLALFGPSGCGKSTTINLLAGLLTPDKGSIRIDDEILFDSGSRINRSAEQRRVGYVFQDARLFPHYTVAGNLHYGLMRCKDGRRFEFDQVVELLGLARLLQRRPVHLSGGEKQRVALGRALLSQPRVLLLDEPLASLDQTLRSEVLPYLERVRDELRIPMVYVSHQFEEVLQLATHVALMDHGTVVAHGDLPSISLHPAMHRMVGSEAIGTVIEGTVRQIGDDGLAHIDLGNGSIRVDHNGLQTGQRVRLQLLARDVILATERPSGLSVRNMLPGTIRKISADDRNAMLVQVDIGGTMVLARITNAAARELSLQPEMPLWVLIKAVTLRSHLYYRALQ